jgi:hypothetical protein
MTEEKYTHTAYSQWTAQHQLSPIPRSQVKQIELLERGLYELVNWLQDELGWDNNESIFDGLADEVNLIARRAYERACND